MYRDQTIKISRRAAGQGGFAIVAAIFLLVVLALLGAFMLTFGTVQHTTSAQDLQGSRAYQATRTGMEWGVYRALRGGGGYCAAPGAETVPPLEDDLAAFAVVVTCNSKTPYTDGDSSGHIYQLTAKASSGTVGGLSYIERELQVTLSGP